MDPQVNAIDTSLHASGAVKFLMVLPCAITCLCCSCLVVPRFRQWRRSIAKGYHFQESTSSKGSEQGKAHEQLEDLGTDMFRGPAWMPLRMLIKCFVNLALMMGFTSLSFSMTEEETTTEYLKVKQQQKLDSADSISSTEDADSSKLGKSKHHQSKHDMSKHECTCTTPMDLELDIEVDWISIQSQPNELHQLPPETSPERNLERPTGGKRKPCHSSAVFDEVLQDLLAGGLDETCEHYEEETLASTDASPTASTDASPTTLGSTTASTDASSIFAEHFDEEDDDVFVPGTRPTMQEESPLEQELPPEHSIHGDDDLNIGEEDFCSPAKYKGPTTQDWPFEALIPGVDAGFVLPVKHTFIHFRAHCPSLQKCEARSASAPAALTHGIFLLKQSETDISHARGDCSPCAYFVYKKDGCRLGDECSFCHLCPRGELKKRKRVKRQVLKTLGGEALVLD
jgi:hypothetical protein